MRLKRLKRDWDDLGDADPLWAVLTAKAGKHGKWNVDDFFQTGENEIASAIDDAQRLGFPTRRELALDFGCGVGLVDVDDVSRVEFGVRGRV